jgi:hypothetical protein
MKFFQVRHKSQIYEKMFKLSVPHNQLPDVAAFFEEPGTRRIRSVANAQVNLELPNARQTHKESRWLCQKESFVELCRLEPFFAVKAKRALGASRAAPFEKDRLKQQIKTPGNSHHGTKILC